MKSLKSIIFLMFIEIAFSFFICEHIYSQRVINGDNIINTYWDFYTNNYTSTVASGKGYTGIAANNDIIGALLNPASVNLTKKLNAQVEYVYKTNVPYTFITNFEINLRPYYPSVSGGVGYRINKYIQAGLLFNSESNYRQDWGEIIQTNEFGEEIGRYDAIQNYYKSVFSLPLIFNYKSIFRAGVTLNYALFMRSFKSEYVGNEGVNYETIGKFQKFYPSFGLFASPVKNLNLGVSFTSGFKERIILVTEGTQIGTIYDTNETDNYFPLKFGVGIEYKISKIPLSVSVDYNYANTAEDSLMKDRHNFNAGIEYNLNEKVILRTGFFTFKDYRKFERSNIYPLGDFDQYFITAGASYKLKKFTISMALMDSHISSGSIKQTIVNGGISWEY